MGNMQHICDSVWGATVAGIFPINYVKAYQAAFRVAFRVQGTLPPALSGGAMWRSLAKARFRMSE